MGIERLVPLRFVLMTGTSHPGPPGAATFAEIEAATQTANWAFRGAGVQFYVASARSMPMTALLPVDDEDHEVLWSQVKPTLLTVFPNIANYPLAPAPGQPAVPGALPTADTPAWRATWLYYAATRFSEPEELVVWVTPDDNTYPPTLHGPRTSEARTLKIPGYVLGSSPDRWKFVHELGHVFGLNHADPEVGEPPGAGFEYVCLPGGATECDRTASPKQGVTSRADFWDHVYLPGTSATNKHRVFATRYAAQQAENETPNSIDLRWIDNGYGDGAGNNCIMSWGTQANPSNGLLQCSVYGVGAASSYYEWWTTWNTHEPKLRGLSWPTTTGGRRGASQMTYRYEPPDWAPYWPAGFSSSQTEMIRLNLRYDVKIHEDELLRAAGATGGRPLLGRKVRRRPAEMLDFDGDQKRDIAVWVPPVDAGSLGTFRVLTSRSNFSFGSELTVPFGNLGDTPVVADYNGDGFADFAVLHDMGIIGDGAAQKQWRICASSVVQPPPPPPAFPTVTHSCAPPLEEVWGDRGDVPYVGTRFSSSSTGELTVYRKSNKTMYTLFLPSFTNQAVQLLNLGNYDHQAPHVGLYDDDARSDIATYIPQQGMFRVWRSQENFGSENLFNFCIGQSTSSCKFIPQGVGTSAQRGGAVPAWGLSYMHTTATSPAYLTRPRGALGLYDPSDGVWHVIWDPFASQTVTTHQWGNTGDLVVDDAIGLPAAGNITHVGMRGDLAVYRSNESPGPGYIHRCSSSGYTCPGGAAQQAITIPGGDLRRNAFAVSDMVSMGDGKPELCVFDPINATVRCHTSDSGYATVIERSFQVPNADFL